MATSKDSLNAVHNKIINVFKRLVGVYARAHACMQVKARDQLQVSASVLLHLNF